LNRSKDAAPAPLGAWAGRSGGRDDSGREEAMNKIIRWPGLLLLTVLAGNLGCTCCHKPAVRPAPPCCPPPGAFVAPAGPVAVPGPPAPAPPPGAPFVPSGYPRVGYR
jgi:hypothetical protein